MFLELAAIKYLLSGGSSETETSSDSEMELPPATLRCDILSLFSLLVIVPMVIGLIFSNYTALESVGYILNLLKRCTVGAIVGYREGDWTDFGTITIPVLIFIFWIILAGVMFFISRHFAALLTEIGEGIPEKIKKVVFVVFLGTSVFCMYIGYQKYQTKKAEEQKEQSRTDRHYRHSNLYY